MSRRDRVLKALSLRGEPDAVPWGEMAIEPGAVRALASALGLSRGSPGRRGETEEPPSGSAALDEEAAVLDALGLDIAPVNCGLPGFEERVERYKSETDMFVMGVVGGAFFDCVNRLGFEGFMSSLRAEKHRAFAEMRRAALENTALALRAVQAGADGIMVGDDIAHSKGTFASPRDLRNLLFPLLGELAAAIAGAGASQLFHSDGDIRAVFEDIVSLGFKAIHPLQPSAGMDLPALKERYGSRICLMGNVDLEDLAAGPEDSVRAAVAEAVRAGAPGGGFIISSASGVISARIPTGHVLAFRDAVKSHGAREPGRRRDPLLDGDGGHRA
jgi:uroporphyrinogen decarboxylase